MFDRANHFVLRFVMLYITTELVFGTIALLFYCNLRSKFRDRSLREIFYGDIIYVSGGKVVLRLEHMYYRELRAGFRPPPAHISRG